MEDTKKQVFKVLVSGDDGWEVFKIWGELLNIDLITWPDVIPTPDKFVEGFLLWLFVCNDLWMTDSIVYFTQFLYSNFGANDFFDSVISILNWLYSVLVQFPSEIPHEILVRNFVCILFEIVTNIVNLFHSKMQLPTLKSPSEISFLKHSSVLFV